MRKKSILSAVAVVCLAVLLSSCAGLDNAGSGVGSNRLVWLIFLHEHCTHGGGGGYDVSFTLRSLALSSVPINLTYKFDVNDVRYENIVVADATRSRSAEDWIRSSGDQDLINLHEKMKSLQAAIDASPEYAAVMSANAKSESVKQLYGADARTQEMASQAGLTRIPQDVDNALNGRPYGPSPDEVVRQRQADARNQQGLDSDPHAKKADAEFHAAMAKLNKIKQKYAVPADQYFALMRKYVPSGSKAWNMNFTQNETEFVYMGIEYGTWTY